MLISQQLKVPAAALPRSLFRKAAWMTGFLLSKAKTIDRQFPYEMKINMTFLGLCTFVQQLCLSGFPPEQAAALAKTRYPKPRRRRRRPV